MLKVKYGNRFVKYKMQVFGFGSGSTDDIGFGPGRTDDGVWVG
jgi:hypothetical protein